MSLFGSYRWGRHHLGYALPMAPQTECLVELYFVEPWWGTSLAEETDCSEYRLFDVAIEGQVVEHDLDIWSEVGHDCVLKRTYRVKSDADSLLRITFPTVKVGQAIVSAIVVKVADADADRCRQVMAPAEPYFAETWKEMTARVEEKMPKEALPVDKNVREAKSYDAKPSFTKGKALKTVEWNFSVGLAQEYAFRFRYKNLSGASVPCRWRLLAKVEGREVCSGTVSFPTTPAKWRMLSITTVTFVNAGDYRLVVTPETPTAAFEFETLAVQ